MDKTPMDMNKRQTLLKRLFSRNRGLVQSSMPLTVMGTIVWVFAAFLFQFIYTEATQLQKILLERYALAQSMPALPLIENKPIKPDVLNSVVSAVARDYPDIAFGLESQGRVRVAADDRERADDVSEAMVRMTHMSRQWLVTVEKLCIGLDCHDGKAVYGVLKFSRMNVDKKIIEN